MADVQSLLKKILSAVKGEDVRGSIHDAIKQCYYDGKAGGNDLEARDRAAAAEAQIALLAKNPSTSSGSFEKEVANARVAKDGTTYDSLREAITEELYKTQTIEVSSTKPTRYNTAMWVNPKDYDFFDIPEIKDDETNPNDTWSSKQISGKTSSVDIKWRIGKYVHVGTSAHIHDDETNSRMCSDLIPCYEGIDVSFIAETAHVNVAALTFYDSDKNVIEQVANIGENGVEHTVTAPSGTRFLRMSSAPSIGWSLRFSESPVFKIIEEVEHNATYFDDEVDYRIAYNHVINGFSQPPYFVNQSGVTKREDGTVEIAPEGYYFLTVPFESFGGNAYIGVKCNRDERIEISFSTNGTTSLPTATAPYMKTKNIYGYEVAQIEKFEENDYPYAIIRIDNRGKSDILTISDVRIVDGEMPLPDKPHYVSVDGSSENDGSIDRPFATVNQALLAGASDIYIYPGVYEQTINLEHAHHCELNISSLEPDGRVIFRDPSATITTTESKVDGYTRVYSVVTERRFGSNNIWLFQEGVSDESTLIDDHDRHPLQRGYKYRCEDTKISRCNSSSVGEALEEIESSDSYKWYLDDATSVLYFSRPRSVSESYPICGSSAKTLFVNLRRDMSLKVSGIESKYMAFDVSKTTNSVIKDCKATNVCKSGAFMYDQALGCEFIRCEAARCFSGSNGDGFNAHSANTGDAYAKQTTVTMIDCWSHDNNDDGYSDHERSETTIIGGLFEFNGKAGVTPSYGSQCNCYNVVSRYNFAGFYYTGITDEAEGGMYGQMYCHNCIAENNNRGGVKAGFRVDGSYNSMKLVDCRAIGNGSGYVIANDLCHAHLVDCKAADNDKVLDGSLQAFIVKNTSLVEV